MNIKWFECPSETWRNKQQNSWRPPPSSWVAIPTGAVQFGASRSVVSSCFDSKCYPDQIKSTGFRSITCWLSPYRSRHLGGLCRIISSPTSRTLDRKNGLHDCFRIVCMSGYVKVSSVLWGRILDWVPDWVWTEGGGIKGSFRQLVRPHFKVRLIGGVMFRLRLSVE